MNKRLRKKKRLGEFDWQSFDVKVVYKAGMTMEASCRAEDEFLELIESMNLCGGGGCNTSGFGLYLSKHIPGRRRPHSGYPTHREAHCTENDRRRIEMWLQTKPYVGTMTIGPLESGWHSKDPESEE